jgi:hypothetical protein
MVPPLLRSGLHPPESSSAHEPATLYFRNVLPPGSNGTVLVVENPCTDRLTFQINGPSVKYMGVGDHPDQKYDHLSLPSKLTERGEFAGRESTYSGARLDQVFCPFTLHVYPSDEMKAAHTTNNPLIFTVISVLIFALTSMDFILYNRTVEWR